jgi:hypothetical protein
LHASDAQHDLRAVRNMIDAGSGYPPHWRGESSDANLATATAMQSPTERHLERRQKYFLFVLQDILYHAYRRAVEVGKARPLPEYDYTLLFRVAAPDVSRSDNEQLARAAQGISAALASLLEVLQEAPSPTLQRLALELVTRFAGEPQSEELISAVLEEIRHASPAQEADQ